MQILLADDHTLIRENLVTFLKNLDPNALIHEAGTFPEAEKVIAQNSPLDLVILDLKMPGMVGFSGIRKLHEAYPDTPIVILTGSTLRQDILGAIENGARGFIPKTIGGKAMVNALKLVLSGEVYIPATLLTETHQQEYPDANVDNPTLTSLTAREREVLSLLAEGQSNKAIAIKLSLKEVTIKAHLQNVYRKVGVNNRTQAVSAAIKIGLVDSPAREDYRSESNP